MGGYLLMKILLRLFSYLKEHTLLILLGISFSLIAVAAEKVNPYVSKLIVDRVLINREFGMLGYYTIILASAITVRAVFLYLRHLSFEYISQKLLYKLRSVLYTKLQFQSFEFFDKTPTGLLMNRMVGDLNAVNQFVNRSLILFLQSVISLAFTISIMISLNVKLTLIILLLVPAIAFNMRKMSKVLRPLYRKIRTASENLTTFVQEDITGIRVIKAFGREKEQSDAFCNVAGEMASTNIAAADARAKYGPLSSYFMEVGLIIILLVGGYFAIKGEISIGDLVAFNGYMLMLRNPITHMVGMVNQWEHARASMEKIFELIDDEPAIQNDPGAVKPAEVNGLIKFENVYFKYGDEYVLKDISFTVRTGTVTAIMGTTGSGKSTIINLIERFYDIDKGKITIDNIDIKKIDLDTLRKNIGIIMQEVFLFSDTIESNIAFGVPDASREQVIRAAKIADAHDFIMDMPNGYDTIIGERGVGLSGGQKQRIAIARAIITNPSILILDDATSSVDMETEREIQETLSKVMKGRTTIIIAHRVSSVMHADQILFLEDGVIVERGTHSELIELGGRYYNIYKEQLGNFDIEYGTNLCCKSRRMRLQGVN